jgi:hypothetical protein
MSSRRKIIGTSLEEIRFLYFTKKIFEKVEHRYRLEVDDFNKKSIKFELDIFIPHINFAIEYDGVFYHSSEFNKKKDLRKNKICKSKGITLLRIREKGLDKILPHDIEYNYNRKESHKESFKSVIEFIKNNFILSDKELIKIEKFDYDNFEIGPEVIAFSEQIQYENSLKFKNPTLAKEWNYEKNNGLIPDKIHPNSNLLVWWKCNCCSYEWQDTPHERNRAALGCLKCRSLGVKNPTLSKEWHPLKNGNLTPFDVSSSSGKKVWWLCSYDGEYEMTVDNRRRLKGCPCHSYNPIKINESNSLFVVNPTLSKEWHPTKNEKKTPNNVFASSRSERAWWVCSKNSEHVWEAKIHTRHHCKQGCPYCNGKKVSKENSLEYTNPHISKQWHPTKNGSLTPFDVTRSSGKSAWWECKNCNHEWQGFINNRVRSIGLCPNCKKN